MRRVDFSVNVVIVVLNCSVQQHLGSGPVSAQFQYKHLCCKELFCHGAAGKYGIFLTMFGLKLTSDLVKEDDISGIQNQKRKPLKQAYENSRGSYISTQNVESAAPTTTTAASGFYLIPESYLSGCEIGFVDCFICVWDSFGLCNM